MMGSLCAGKFSLDGNWYRGFIERVSPTEPRFEVYFMDFGNREKLKTEDVRPLDAALSAVPAQARPACLAYVKVGGIGGVGVGVGGREVRAREWARGRVPGRQVSPLVV